MTIQKRKLSEQVAEELKNMIVSNRFHSGEKLPPEDELSRIFSVSRITIREAILRLNVLGILDVRQGTGTFVREITPYAYVKTLLPMLSIDNNSLKDIFEIRQIIECKAAELAALYATPNDLEKLHDLLPKMHAFADCGNLKNYYQADRLFHYEVACCTNNRLLITIEELISDLVEASISVGITPLNALKNSMMMHQKIYEAIRKKDSLAASALMQAHLQGGISYVKDYLDEYNDKT